MGTDNNFREYFFGKGGSVEWRINELKKHKNYTHYSSNIINIEEVENIFIQQGKS